MSSDFRDHLFPIDHPRLASVRSCDPYSYLDVLRQDPLVAGVLAGWQALFDSPEEFRGVTTDGQPIPDLFEFGGDEGVAASTGVSAALALLDALGPEDKAKIQHPINSRVWRAWMNPEMYLNRYGIRLEEVDEKVHERVFDLLQACLSPSGYEKLRAVMAINGFLGELVELPQLLNEHSYNINIYGTPSPTEPWGWNMWGHHLGINCLFVGNQQVLTPVFFGSEPNVVDSGEHAGLTLFGEQESSGLDFVRSLSAGQIKQAVLFDKKRDPGMAPDRLHPGDELHLAGAFQDNRVIPYEGIPGSELDADQREALVALVDLFLDYQPDGPRAARIADVRRHLDETYFCWIGGRGDEDAFYYRVQSPVIITEFDHHAGIFLTNSEPEKFHTHTVVRTPNGNDFGAALIRQATNTPHRLDGPA